MPVTRPTVVMCVLRGASQVFSVYSHAGPIRHRKCGYILMPDQSDTGSAGDLRCLPVATGASLCRRHKGVHREYIQLMVVTHSVTTERSCGLMSLDSSGDEKSLSQSE
eukprot:1082026-Prorocentrum_minimum.AAC.5